MSLEKIAQFRVGAAIVEETEDALQAAGADGYEVFVLWSGLIQDGLFAVESAHVPKQESFKTPQGLLVRVEGAALHELNVWLYEHGQQLGAQVHAHPTDAYHSETDSAYPIVTSFGGLSIVTPDFGYAGVFTRRTAAYRLTRSGWIQLSRRHLRRLVTVEP